MDNYQIRTKLYDAASLYDGFNPADEDSYKDSYDGKVYATLVVYRDRVIAADIASADPRGFISGLEK